MKTIKVTNTLLKKQNCFTYGQIAGQKRPLEDPTVIITTTVTHFFPEREGNSAFQKLPKGSFPIINTF